MAAGRDQKVKPGTLRNAAVKKVVSVIGPSGSFCNEAVYRFGKELGRCLIDNGFIIICGGMDGIMEAVCKGAHASSSYVFGCTIGIIPSADKTAANQYCDIVIPTGIGAARNQLVVSSGDAIIAIGGGAGTLSELAFAWQLRKKIICYTGFEGWSRELAGKNIDSRAEGLLIPAASIEGIITLLKGIA